jgi:hypothetical protein
MSRLPTKAALAASLAAAALLAGGAAQDARAQNLPPYDFSQYDVLLNVIGTSNVAAGSKGQSRETPRRRQAPARPTARQRATLRFRARQAVTDRLYREVVQETGADPAVVDQQLDAARAEYRRVLKRVAGWRVQDLGDVAAFGLVQSYVQVHGATKVSKRGLARVRGAVRDDLARQRSVRRLSDTRQQDLAERLELRVIFFISDLNGARMRGDAGGVQSARSALRDWAKDLYGVDVERVRLTARGLVRR